jgi:ABC-type multidrug transport system fused ATPase/permease subunit
VFWKKETLLTAQAFTSIALISLLTTPVIVFIQGLPSVMQCVGNFDRIQEYCNYHGGGPETSLDDDVLTVPEEGFDLEPLSLEERTSRVNPIAQDPEPEVIRLDGHAFAWNKGSPSHVIRQTTLNIKRGTVTAIIGPIGSGKSSFMNALLGELSAVHEATFQNGEAGQGYGRSGIKQRMAYCAQTPWIENGSIRHNIVGASTWDEKWYSTVLAACCLDTDLEHLKSGDQTRVGSKGVNLSGGQKHRVVSDQPDPNKIRVADHQRHWLELSMRSTALCCWMPCSLAWTRIRPKLSSPGSWGENEGCCAIMTPPWS